MKNQLLISGGILITFLSLTACGNHNSNSETVSIIEAGKPIAKTTPISQTSPRTQENPVSSKPPSPPIQKNTTQKLAPGTYCYMTKTETLDADAKITISSSNQVNGNVTATIHNEKVGYYSSYSQTLKGILEGEKAKLDIVTKIEYDTQKSQENWIITESSLNTDRQTFQRVDCAALREDNSTLKPVRVNFDRGTTSKTIKNSVVRGTRDTYILGAKKGQQMNLKITSLENNAVFEVISPQGQILQEEVTNWNTKLPTNGDYQVIVGGTRGNANYELTVEIK